MEHGYPYCYCSCKFIKQYSVKHANWFIHQLDKVKKTLIRQSPGTTAFPCLLPEVLMMDLDILVRGNLDELFQLRAMSFTFVWANYNDLSRPYSLDWFSKGNLQHVVWNFGLVNRNCDFLSGSNMDGWEMSWEFKGVKAPTPPAGYKTIRPYIKGSLGTFSLYI